MLVVVVAVVAVNALRLVNKLRLTEFARVRFKFEFGPLKGLG